jgi:hypothetical protein
VTGQSQFASAVTELSPDPVVGSSIDNGTTLLPCDLRQLDWHRALGPTAPLCGRPAPYPGAMPALAPFHHPLKSRVIGAHGSSLNAQQQRGAFPPAIPGGSTAQPMRHSLLRWAGSLAVVGGVSLRHRALRFASRLLLPMTKASLKRGSDAISAPLPVPAERLRPLLARTPATAWPRDGESPLGPAHGVMVGKEEPDRSLRTSEAAAEHGAEAQQVLHRLQDCGRKVPAAVSDDSPSCTDALKAVYLRWAPSSRQKIATFKIDSRVSLLCRNTLLLVSDIPVPDAAAAHCSARRSALILELPIVASRNPLTRIIHKPRKDRRKALLIRCLRALPSLQSLPDT